MIANEENVLVPVVFLLARRARRKRERAKDARKTKVSSSKNAPRGDGYQPPFTRYRLQC